MNNEKLELYNRAKEAYYNGAPIMEDFEFDALEKELGLENKSYIGTKHNPSYTIEHPFIMGSLSKVQIHEKNGVIDWDTYYADVCNYIYRNTTNTENVIITPKFDGCSFEVEYQNNRIVSISTRGDGEYGRDIYDHIHAQIADALKNVKCNGSLFTFRGEVLIDKNLFIRKYSEFVNPRSFVAGVLGRKYEGSSADEIEELNNMCADLSTVIYNVNSNSGNGWEDNDWTMFDRNLHTSKYGYIDNKYLPQYFIINKCIINATDLENIYNKFSEYRNVCPYALDGIVIKPEAHNRMNALTVNRPKDCVAIKFIPMLEETEIVDIEWNLGKTGEWNPVVITKPVIMDGKSITRASGHNAGYLIDNKLSIGCKIILSLAGDIIPFIYKITDTSNYDETKLNIPNNTIMNGCHLMAILDKNEVKHLKFVNSAVTLNIPNLGPAEIENIWNYLNQDNGATDDFFGITLSIPDNILLIKPEDVYFGITSATKNGATGKATKIKKAFEETVHNISLKDIIKSCNFTACGDKVAEQCANYLITGKADFTHLANKGYEWCLNENNTNDVTNNLSDVMNIMGFLGKTFDDFKARAVETATETSNQIPVILTGEPNDYASKGEFLKLHPEYRLTGKWTEVKIVFTNSLESNTGKMKKAREKNIEIRIY